VLVAQPSGMLAAPQRSVLVVPAEHHAAPRSELSSMPEPSPQRHRRARSDPGHALVTEAPELAGAAEPAAPTTPARLPWLPDFPVDGSKVAYPPASSAVAREGPDARRTPAHTQTLHVTIGRLEIRATPPALPTPPRRAESPRLTLDAYLAARAGRQA
jgi:hypothetical protein